MLFSFCWLLGCCIACAAASLLRRPVAGVILFAVALFIRVVPALVFRLPAGAIVSFDIESMRIVAGLLRSGQDVYSQAARHPYLPLQMYAMAAAAWLAERTELPFEVWVKLPAIVADAAIPLVLARWVTPAISKERANRMAAVYALNPLSTAVVVVHGQFDSVPLLALIGALVLLRSQSPSVRATGAAGLLFGLAVLAKPWPIFLFPLAAWRARGRARLPVFVAAVAVGPVAGGLLYCALLREAPWSMVYAVAKYGGVVGTWGLPLLVKQLCRDGGCAGPLSVWAVAHARMLLAVAKVVFGVTLLAVTVRVADMPLERGGMVVTLAFYVLAYGWGYNYLIWVLPLLLLAEPALISAAYLAITTATTLAVLYGYGGVYSAFLGYFDLQSPVWRYSWATGVPLWMLCAVLLVARILPGRLARGRPIPP